MPNHRSGASAPITNALKFANRDLSALTTPNNKTKYFDRIPLGDMIGIVKKYGFIIDTRDADQVYIQCMKYMQVPKHDTQRAVIGLTHPNERRFTPNPRVYALTFTYYRMDSGRWEIVAYVS